MPNEIYELRPDSESSKFSIKQCLNVKMSGIVWRKASLMLIQHLTLRMFFQNHITVKQRVQSQVFSFTSFLRVCRSVLSHFVKWSSSITITCSLSPPLQKRLTRDNFPYRALSPEPAPIIVPRGDVSLNNSLLYLQHGLSSLYFVCQKNFDN